MLNGIDGIEGLTDEQKEQINGLSKGLLDKNKDLLTKLSNNKENDNSAHAKLAALEEFKRSAEIKAAQDAENWNEATRLKDEAHKASIEEELARADGLESQLKVLLVDNGISAALDSVNISKELKAGAIAMLTPTATITEGKAQIDGKSLSEAIQDWSKTETGKAFCLAHNNSGGNANGSGQQQSKNTDGMSQEQIRAYEINQRFNKT